ncbi:hypothetical protein C5Y96_09210 [Blastopirellula marina]|uniref:Uncharacterized protein n=1 Tax=Blastopirellula marina TaxID=124 RepID=A0A2S8FUG0_9BACT|nr:MULTISPECIES: hypothetical protein [Pirellulaceae]PQO35817.1 hypothetical protein C5Y96_09210 [Blastopirellula marina]RCS53392.1 hypothetical protein DTL36_09220 [Bremerella cremea]
MSAPIQWEYPLYLIAHGGGYTSIVDPQDTDDQPQHILTTHSNEQVALNFMQQFAIIGEPRQLNNDREFRWFLKSLKLPVTKVAYDPEPVEFDVNAKWIAKIKTLLEDYLIVDNSPWNYPVYVIKQQDGYSSTIGNNEDGEPITLLNLFTEEEKAKKYAQTEEGAGELMTLHNMEHVREMLLGLRESVSAVAMDPVYEENESSSQYCIGVDALLDKYLVLDQ